MNSVANMAVEQLEQRVILSAGALDATFAEDGIYTRPSLATSPTQIITTMQSDGKALVGGFEQLNGQSTPYLARFTSAGMLDQKFGRKILPLGALFGVANGTIDAIAETPDGKIVVAGDAFSSTAGAVLFIARL